MGYNPQLSIEIRFLLRDTKGPQSFVWCLKVFLFVVFLFVVLFLNFVFDSFIHSVQMIFVRD